MITAQNLNTKLQNNGLLVITIRDYNEIIKKKPKFTQPSVFDNGQVIVFQVRDWMNDGNIYTITHFILKEINGHWQTTHTTTIYRALLREEFSEILSRTGFSNIRWHMPEKTGYYQPIVTARK